jgi:hypothetical protein
VEEWPAQESLPDLPNRKMALCWKWEQATMDKKKDGINGGGTFLSGCSRYRPLPWWNTRTPNSIAIPLEAMHIFITFCVIPLSFSMVPFPSILFLKFSTTFPSFRQLVLTETVYRA